MTDANIMNLTDTHAHLYLEEFKADREEMMQRAADAGIAKIYLPNIDSSTISDLYIFEEKYHDTCSAMMGLHPCYVKEDYKKELDKIYKELCSRPFSAIGEIGLDFYWDKSNRKKQEEAFLKQLTWASELGLPIAIHSRESTLDLINLLEANQDKAVRGVFHCFSGNEEEAQRIVNIGFYLGIGGVITFKNSTLSSAINKIGLENILLETDAPYLAPVPFRGKRNESSYLLYVAEFLAKARNLEVSEVVDITSSNAINLFGNKLIFD